MASLYENIKKRRTELGLTQSELAAMVGYADKDMISKIEHGKIDLKESRITRIAKALEISPSILFGDGSYKIPPGKPPGVAEKSEEYMSVNKIYGKADEKQKRLFVSILKAITEEE